MSKVKREGANSTQGVEPKIKTKRVHNRSNGKIELLIEDEIVVIPPRGTVNVPIDFEIPNGIGLYAE